jgi:ethanolamine transporter EutH
MKRIVTICGLIAGVIVSIFMVSSIAVCYNKESFEGNMLLGYASMLLAFSLVFVGIKNYRDKHNGGFVTFGKAFTIGLYISLIASTVYMIVWLFDYYFFIPDFMEKFTASTIKKLQEDGVSGPELESQIAEMGTYKELYKNPMGVILLTYMEILPVGLVVSLISALILKRTAGLAKS